MKQNKIIFLLVFAGLLWAGFAFAQDLEVEFEESPLFDKANFLPGDSVVRWIKVTNNSGKSQSIATEAINALDPESFGDVLSLEIKEEGNILFSGRLSQFFDAGEIYLSDLAQGSQAQYDYGVTFDSNEGNSSQNKSMAFDIIIGFQGEEEIENGIVSTGGGAGGGSVLSPGLTILDESVKIIELGETSLVLSWETSYSSTSQVIYGDEGEAHTLDLGDTSGSPPKYGYAHTTPEYDTDPRVANHQVTITGLTPGTKYYFRTVSHASLAISEQYYFVTLSEREDIPQGEDAVSRRETAEGGFFEAGESSQKGITEGSLAEEEKKDISEQEKEEPGLNRLLATVSSFFTGDNFLFLLILMLTILLLLFLFSRKKAKN